MSNLLLKEFCRILPRTSIGLERVPARRYTFEEGGRRNAYVSHIEPMRIGDFSGEVPGTMAEMLTLPWHWP